MDPSVLRLLSLRPRLLSSFGAQRTRTNGWQRDCTICNVRAQGIQLRVVHSHEHELDHFEEGLALQIRYGKTFTNGIYVDTSDLASLSSSSSPTSNAFSPRMDIVQRVPW